jgi:plastocyanin
VPAGAQDEKSFTAAGDISDSNNVMESGRSRPSSAISAVTIVAWIAWSCGAACASAATIALTITQANGKPLPQSVITLDPIGGEEHRIAPAHAVMDQVDRAFAPDVLVVPVGSTVAFPNTDSVSHQIYSFSPAKKFQLPLYRGKPYPPVQFSQPGLVTLGCNIHDFMLAYILVTDAPYFGLADAAGAWSAEVPSGSYRLTLWHPRLSEKDQIHRQISVAEGDRTAVTIVVPFSLQPAPLSVHPHSWDGY